MDDANLNRPIGQRILLHSTMSNFLAWSRTNSTVVYIQDRSVGFKSRIGKMFTVESVACVPEQTVCMNPLQFGLNSAGGLTPYMCHSMLMLVTGGNNVRDFRDRMLFILMVSRPTPGFLW